MLTWLMRRPRNSRRNTSNSWVAVGWLSEHKTLADFGQRDSNANENYRLRCMVTRGWHGKIFCTESPLYRPHSHPRLSVCILLWFLSSSHPQSLLLVLHIIFLHLVFCMLFFLFWDKSTAIKTYVQQSDHSSSATHLFSVDRLLIFPLNFIAAKRHYRYRGITAFPITV